MPRRASIVAVAVVIGLAALAGHALHSSSSNDAVGSDRPTGQTAAPLTSGQTAAPTLSTDPAQASASAASRRAAASSSASAAQRAAAVAAGEAAASRAAAARTGLTTALSNILGVGDSFSVGAIDLTTGQTVSAGATAGMTEASIVKLDFLETILLQQQQAGAEPGGDVEDDLELMIEHSDNNAAQRIWYDLGRNQGVESYNALLGLTQTVLDPTGTWGLSTSSAADQLRLLQALVSTTSPLSAASRAYALDLLNSVEVDQRWGVSAAADAGSSTANKNGWLNIDSDDGLWAINSDGIIVVHGHQVLMSVLTQHQPNYGIGVNRNEAAAKLVATALG